MVERRRFGLATFALIVLGLVALPSLAAAHLGFVGGFSQMGGAIGAKWNLTTGTLAGPEETFGGESSIVDIAITPDGTRAYGVKIGGEVIPFDVASGVAGTPIQLSGDGRAIAITPDGTRAYVVDPFGDAALAINLATGTVSAPIPVGSFPSAIAITPDGTRAYVANTSSNNVSVIDLASNTTVNTIPVGTGPSGIAITPDGTRAYVSNRTSSSVSRIDLATDTVSATIPLGSTEPRGIAITPDGTRAYLPANFGSSTEVVPINLTNNTVGTSIPISGFPGDIAITPDGSRGYVPGGSPDQVTPIDLGTNTALTGFNVNFRPESVAVVPNQPPHASFTVSPANAVPGQTVAFNAGASTDSDGTVVRYDWDFGDGSSAANAGGTPSHAYSKPGTYTVTLTATDNEGCSTRFVFTGQTAYCNGSSVARTTRMVVVAEGKLPICPSVKAKASTFVPKRRPGHVLPGVRVRLSTGVPSRLVVTANLIYELDGKPASAGLGTIKVNVNKWRRVRFAIPPELRKHLPIGTPVKVAVRIESSPRGGAPCEASVTNRNLKVHVVKVFPNRVQELRVR